MVRGREEQSSSSLDALSLTQHRRAMLLLAAIAMVALGARLYHLDRRTISHPELFAPGIPLPAYTVEPTPRYTLSEVIRYTLNGDIHPPAFYLAELAWTGIAGTTLFALRLPSAIVGTVAVMLLFFYARREAGTNAALLAAALLSLHGYHVFWSQHARMWVLLSCLALGAALLLARLIDRPSRGSIIAYAVVTAAGVWTDYYFWPFFLALTLSATAATIVDRRHVAALDAQMLAGGLASPMLVYLHYQMQRGNFLSPELSEPLFSILPVATIASSWALTAFLTAIAGSAVAAGVTARRTERVDVTHVTHADASPAWFFVAASLMASTFVLLALPAVASRLTILLAAVFPWLTSVAWLGARAGLARRTFTPASHLGRVARAIVDHSSASLVLTTLALLLTVHLVREPVVVGRGLVMLAPLVALLMARGVFALKFRPARVAAGIALLALSAASTVESYARRNSPRDYQELATQLMPQLRAGDVILVENGWWTTPIHYYLPPDRFRVLLARDVAAPLPSRVWIVTFRHDATGEVATADRLAAATLPRYVKVAHADALLGYAALYEPAPPAPIQ